MKKGTNHEFIWGLRFSIELYSRLVRIYPRNFRQEFGGLMMQAFQDKYLEAAQWKGPIRMVIFWTVILGDAFNTILAEHLSEWRNDMHKRLEYVQGVAYIGLIIPALFAIGNIGFYTLGIEPVFGGIVNVIDSVQAAGFEWLMTLLVVVDPILAILFTLPSVVEVQLQPEGGGLAGVTFKKAGAMQYSVLAIGLGLMTIFTVFVLAENWLCIIGQRLSC